MRRRRREGGRGACSLAAMVRAIKDGADWAENVKNSGKTVIVDFTAVWCGPCRMIGPKFEEFSLTFTDMLFVKVDVDECDSVAAKAGISAMPTFQVYKAGQKVDEIVGASPEKLEALIKAALTK